MKFEIIFYETKTKSPVGDFISGQPAKTRLKIIALLKRLRHDPRALGPFSEKLTDDLFELRLFHNTHWIRIVYAYQAGKIILLLHGFHKKSNKIPKKEIETSQERLSEYIRNRGDTNG